MAFRGKICDCNTAASTSGRRLSHSPLVLFAEHQIDILTAAPHIDLPAISLLLMHKPTKNVVRWIGTIALPLPILFLERFITP
jgi:hypothetical protein